MKKILIIIGSIFLLTSCISNEEKLIRTYEENFMDTQIDLNFKPIKTKKIADALSIDSLTYYDSLLISEGEKEIEECKSQISDLEFKNSLTEIKYKYESDRQLKDLYQESIKANNNIISIDKKIIKDIEDKNYSKVSDRLRTLTSKRDIFLNKDSIVGSIWECTFQITNPILNNAKQTRTEKYLFSLDNSKIIRALD